MANWFECKVRYDKLQENGAVKKVTEPYLVDALSFTEAEARITEEQTPFNIGRIQRVGCEAHQNRRNILQRGRRPLVSCQSRIHYNRRKTAAEKRSTSLILVQASNFKEAHENFVKGMAGTMAAYDILSISETPLMDVYKMKVVD